MKTRDFPTFSLRVPQITLDKLGYIAKYNGRTKNKEIEMLIKTHIENFEKQHGKISYEDMNKLDIK